MTKAVSLVAGLCAAALAIPVGAAIITVTTIDSVNPAPGQTSLAQALANLSDGDEIRFDISGPGPHYLVTPPGGYPQIQKNNVTIDGYSQPGATHNSNPILASNNAKIRIILDSRNGGQTVLDYDGYGASESAILGVVGATNVTVRGLGFLGRIVSDADVSGSNPALYCVSFAAKAADGRIRGCWMGVDADGKSVAGANAGVTGFRFRDGVDEYFCDRLAVGVPPASTNAPADFNVIVGMKIPIIVEGADLRVSGNFIGVLPSGTNDYNNAVAKLPNEGAIQVGRHGGGTLIGTDGDGVNDENERNVISGVLPRSLEPANGYNHIIEFYGGGPRTNVVVAGNYFGVGIDGQTRFTNGVPLLSGQTGTTRIGSDFDGKSDTVEGNLIFNHYPSSLFPTNVLVRDFLDGLGVEAIVSLRGNKLVNNFVPPVSPLRDSGEFIKNYFAKAVLDPDKEVSPMLSTNSTTARLIGTVPVVDTNIWPAAIVDVYLPDSEGLANRLPDVPGGFIQGSRYLGSFVEGSSADLNPNPGEFEFDISRLNLALGTKVTVTANYSQDPVGGHNTPTLTTLFSSVVELGKPAPTAESPLVVSRDGNNLTLSWGGTGFILQSATAVAGPWTNELTSGTTFKTQAAGPGKFFRLVRGTAPPPPPSTSPSLVVTRSQGALTVTWSGTGFKLQSAASLLGPWTDEQAPGNTFTASVGAGARFFRLVGQ